MKIGFLLLFYIFFNPIVFAQNIPQNPNKLDKKGLRQGNWTICYDSNWNIINDCKSATYYRLITYKDDKPIGKVRHYYLSGKMQMEAQMTADRPQEIFEGLVTWYRENGTKETERTFSAGKQVSERSFDEQGKEITYTWQQIYDLGKDAYEQKDYAKAIRLLEDALPLAEKKFTKVSKEYVSNLNSIGD